MWKWKWRFENENGAGVWGKNNVPYVKTGNRYKKW